MLNDEQQTAINTIDSWLRGILFTDTKFMSLTGNAGCGKTFCLKEIYRLFPDSIFTALTAKAAQRVRDLTGAAATTLHSALYMPPTVRGNEIEFSVLKEPTSKKLVIDESSMLTPKLWSDLQFWAKKGVKILFVGDSFQLPCIISETEAIKYGSDFSVFKMVKGPKLSTIVRNDDEIIKVASLLRTNGTISKNSTECYSFIKTGDVVGKAVDDYLQDMDDHVLITWKNKIRMEANRQIRTKLGILGNLPDKNEPILLCKNGQGFLNGDLLKVNSFTPGPTLNNIITYWMSTVDNKKILVSAEGRDEPFDGFMPKIKNWKEYVKQRNKFNVADPIPISYGYVFTAHKMQGHQARRITIFIDKNDLTSYNFNQPTKLPDDTLVSFAVRWLYVSITRAQHKLTLIVGT